MSSFHKDAPAAVIPGRETDTGRPPLPSGDLDRLEALRTLIVLVMAVGYASTMPLGPQAYELGTLFGYQPSWLAVQLLFALSGYLCLRSLRRNWARQPSGRFSGLRMIASRARRNLPLLALVTALIVGIVYPALRDPASAHGAMGVSDLAGYFAMTVSCVDPSRPLPGLMDDAHYACLLQGAVWTFRWGVVAYVGSAVAWHLGLLSRDRWVAVWAALAATAYFVTHLYSAKSGAEWIVPLETGLRLMFPFMAGMAVFAYREHVMTARTAVGGMVVLVAFAGLNYHLLPWTPVIEMSLVSGFAMAAFGVLHSRGRWFAWMEGWSPLALPLFLLNWPVAQLWLYAVPDITPVQLVAVTLATIVTTALALRASATTSLPRPTPA